MWHDYSRAYSVAARHSKLLRSRPIIYIFADVSLCETIDVFIFYVSRKLGTSFESFRPPIKRDI